MLASGIVLAGTAGAGAGPENISYPLRLIDGRITPSNRLFVRDHFAPPEISLADWRLRIEGRVSKPCELTFSDLLEQNVAQVEVVMECAGNVAGGSAVSNAFWKGVPIRELLQPAKPAGGAAFALFEGVDSGRLFENHTSLPYARVVPVERCLEPEGLIAFMLNGQTLPARNGFPARAIFPGCYGMDSVKWVKRIVLMNADEAAAVYLQSGMDRLYTRTTGVGDSAQRTPITNTQIKSVISWPGSDSTLPMARHKVWGFAWGGTGRIREVLVSTDGGNSWDKSTLTPGESQYAWTRWEFDWPSSPGQHILISRASDESGAQQPLRREPSRKDQYELNWCVPVRCSIR